MEERTLMNSIYIWLENVKKRTVKAATYDRLLISWKMLRDDVAWSNVYVDKWTVAKFQSYLNHLRDEGYSISTIKKQFHLISAYMKYAFANGEIKSPVYLGVKIPSEPDIPKGAEAYTPAEQAKLIDALVTYRHPAYAAAEFMLYTGLRIGEVLALTWDDILWNRRGVIVSKTLVKMSSGACESYVQSGAKTRSSNRKVPLSGDALDILKYMLVINADSRYIFGSDKPMSYATAKYWVKKACTEAGVPYKGMHIFRHTFASNCYSKGADVKILSKLLGHASVSITYNTYIHLFGDELDALRQVVQ